MESIAAGNDDAGQKTYEDQPKKKSVPAEPARKQPLAAKNVVVGRIEFEAGDELPNFGNRIMEKMRKHKIIE